MALPFYNWSRTAASNATADSTVNWAEGMAPSAVNDSARAMMASTAAFRDDISGAIATGGTSTAYTVTSYQVFDTLAHLNGQIIAFTPHATNGATVTLNVDGLGAKPLRSAPSVELPAGVLVQGTPYCALYNSSDQVFYLQGFYTSPYIVPIGACIDYFGSSSPNSSFVLPYGQAISRTTYSTLFSLFSTTYGAGDGSTTFNVPDIRGRIIAGKDDMGGSAASRLTSSYFGTSAAALGAVGGSQSHTLTASESAVLTYTTTFTVLPSQYGPSSIVSANPGANPVFGGSSSTGAQQTIASGGTLSTTTNAGGNPHAICQPTIIANKLLRII
jgi:microcystin-dependent protein